MNNQHILGALKDVLSQSVDLESAIEFLRNSGLTKLYSIEMLRKVLSLSYDEAYFIVHNSKTWSDVKEFDEKLMNDFLDVLEELGDSD